MGYDIVPNKQVSQQEFDSSIGQLDRILSVLIMYSKWNGLDEPNVQTLKHHAEDMIGAGKKVLEGLRLGQCLVEPEEDSPDRKRYSLQIDPVEGPRSLYSFFLWDRQAAVGERMLASGYVPIHEMIATLKAHLEYGQGKG